MEPIPGRHQSQLFASPPGGRAVNERPSTNGLSFHRNLQTETWTSDVAALEAGLTRHHAAEPLVNNDCRVAFFEIVDDANLHVNVTHVYQTVTVSGWAGPAVMAEGFVHNRRFQSEEPLEVLRLLRKMVFAERA